MVTAGLPSSHTAAAGGDMDIHEVLYQEVPDLSQVSQHAVVVDTNEIDTITTSA